MLRVDVKPWVLDDVSAALKSTNPAFRLTLSRVILDLDYDLPRHLTHYERNRIANNPQCFRYERTYLNGHQLQHFSFVVRDALPEVLEVIWVVPSA